MAALHIIAVMFLTVNFLGGGFGVTDEEFKVGTLFFNRSDDNFKLIYIIKKVIGQMNFEVNVSLSS